MSRQLGAGGDFAATASATTAVGDVATYTWSSTPALVSDVQDWVDGVIAHTFQHRIEHLNINGLCLEYRVETFGGT